MRYFAFLLLFLNLTVWAQGDFNNNLQKVDKLQNSEFPDHLNLLQVLKKSAKTSQELYLTDYYFSLYYTAKAEYDSALMVLDKAKRGFKTLNESLKLANVFKQIGVVKYSFLSDFVAGKTYLDSATLYYQKIKHDKGVADCKRHHAVIYYQVGNIPKSNEVLKSIADFYPKGSMKNLDIKDLLINNYIALNDIQNAYRISKNLPEQYLKINEIRRYAYSLLVRGHLQKKLGLIDQSEFSLKRSIELSKKNNYYENLIDNNRYLGVLYTEKGNYEQAEYYLAEALKYANQVNDKYAQMLLKSSLGRHYIAKHEFAKGDDFQNEAHRLSDSLYSAENNNKMAEYEAKFKTLEKEAKLKEAQLDIAKKKYWIWGLAALIVAILLFGILLWRITRIKTKAAEAEKLKNLEIDAQNRLISAREIERRRIAKELHDSVGSQLTVVSTSLDNAFYLFENQKLKPEKLENINTEVRLAAQSLRDTIWATYNTEISVSDLKSRIQEFVKKFADENSFKIDMDIKGNEVILNPIEGLNLFRIVQEALNNTQKYAKASLVKITGHFSENDYLLTISDNGKGFDLAQHKINESYGLNNMKARAEEIGASFKIFAEVGTGSKIIIKKT